MVAVPQSSPFYWLAPLILGFILALSLTPVARLLAISIGNIDRPKALKIHRTATPLMGGTAVYLAFAISVIATLPLTKPVVGLLAGGLTAITVGVLDERYTLAPVLHGAGQTIAAVITIVCGVGVIETVSLPTAGLTAHGLTLPLAVGTVVTILWLVGMMNTVNFLDGLDGLVAGIATLASLLLAIWASEPSRFFLPPSIHHEDLLMPLALAGALLGFLPYNWHVARIFLGDSGSMFVGLAIGALSIVGPAKLATALLVLLIPVLDVAWAIVRRRLHGRSFLSGDKQHVYHRMLELGLSHTTTVLLLYFLCINLGVLDLLLVKVQKLVAFVLLSVLFGVAVVLLEVRASARNSVSLPDAGR